MATVVLVGTLDTKGTENDFVRGRLRAAGVEVLVVDTGVLEAPVFTPDINRQEVAAAAGVDFDALVTTRDRGPAITAMAEGTSCITRARAWLEAPGYEVLVFHMTDTGGRVLESLAAQGLLTGVLDVTTTELNVYLKRPGQPASSFHCGVFLRSLSLVGHSTTMPPTAPCCQIVSPLLTKEL